MELGSARDGLGLGDTSAYDRDGGLIIAPACGRFKVRGAERGHYTPGYYDPRCGALGVPAAKCRGIGGLLNFDFRLLIKILREEGGAASLERISTKDKKPFAGAGGHEGKEDGGGSFSESFVSFALNCLHGEGRSVMSVQ